MIETPVAEKCMWSDYRPVHYVDEKQNELGKGTELFCTHSHNEGGWCKIEVGEDCIYYQER